MKPINFITAVSGLNNKLDPVRIRYNPEIGVSDLVNAVNITIDNTGRPVTRKGSVLLESGTFHSVWAKDNNCFVIYDSNSPSGALIYKLGTDLSLSFVNYELTEGKPMAFCDVNGDTYYSNGVENGVIVNGISWAEPWPTCTYDKTFVKDSFSNAPIGQFIEFYKGRIIIAQDSILWFSEPNSVSMFDLEKNFWQLDSTIQMIKPVESGLFVSDKRYTWFLQGTSPNDFKQIKVASYPAHYGSVATDYTEIDDLDLGEVGEAAVWSSKKGLCLGLPSGRMKNITKERLEYPQTFAKGACLVKDYHVINTIY